MNHVSNRTLLTHAFLACVTAFVASALVAAWGSGGPTHVAAIALLGGLAAAAMACVVGYSSILGFSSGPLPDFEMGSPGVLSISPPPVTSHLRVHSPSCRNG